MILLRHVLASVAAIAPLLMFSVRDAMAQVASADGKPPAEVQLRYNYTGYFGDNNGLVEGCRGSRRNGTLVVEAKLRYGSGAPPDNVYYGGPGKVSFNVDDCDLKPQDGTHAYCNMSVVSNYEAEVSLEVLGVIENEPREASIRWKPTVPVAATVNGCERWPAEDIRGTALTRIPTTILRRWASGRSR
jgi:hypothetical protein